MSSSRPSFVQPPLLSHKDSPEGFRMDPTEARFDPAVHLQLEPPAAVKTLDFKDVAFPYSAATQSNFPGLAYTRPFRLLSPEGVKLIRGAVDRNMHLAKKNERAPMCIRGLGYQSQAVRDLTYCDEVNNLLSDLAGKPVAPHGMTMNIGHTNVGKVKTGVAVDKWHTDSVDYVYVLILSDIEEMKGGELQVLQMSDARGNTFQRLKMDGVPTDLVETVNYAAAGYCIFMQGSRILHQVTPVLAAREPRISFVNSFMSRDVFDDDSTRFYTFSHQDPRHVTYLEFARHRAWRAEGRLRHIMENVPFGTPTEELAEMLTGIAKELTRTAKIITGEVSDRLELLGDAEEGGEVRSKL